MCGIAGIVGARRLHRVTRIARVGCATCSGTGARMKRLSPRRPGGARPPAAEHRRSGRRPPAAGQRGRHASGSSSTARSTTTPTLRPELEARGPPLPHAVATPRRSSTPTSSGATTASHSFRGMFAFAIWDAPQRAPAARPRPPRHQAALLDACTATALLFASEIKAILASGLVERRANEARLPELLGTRYLSGTETLFKGIHKLLPGHTLVLRARRRCRSRAVLGRAGRGSAARSGADPSRRRSRPALPGAAGGVGPRCG